MQYLAQRLGVEAVCPVASDPVSWMPDAPTIQAMQEADLIILNGANFEAWPEKVSLPESNVLRTASGLELLHYENVTIHTHGPGGEHSHEGIDGHTWLDPINAKAQAERIQRRLAQLRPERADEFAANFAKLAADLEALDAEFWGLSPPPLLANHPAYNYLAKRYGWSIYNLDLDPEEMPEQATFDGPKARHLLWESSPSAEIATQLNTWGITSIVFSPAETASDTDYLGVMQRNLAALKAHVP